MDTFFFDHPAIPSLPPVMGAARLWEMEQDNTYLKYLYPAISRRISELIEEECDKLEYEGSPLFDDFPDKTFFILLASKIGKTYKEKYPDDTQEEGTLLRDIIEVLLFHEVMYRRNRYRNHKRLYL